jgi:hypothetical protein
VSAERCDQQRSDVGLGVCTGKPGPGRGQRRDRHAGRAVPRGRRSPPCPSFRRRLSRLEAPRNPCGRSVTVLRCSPWTWRSRRRDRRRDAATAVIARPMRVGRPRRARRYRRHGFCRLKSDAPPRARPRERCSRSWKGAARGSGRRGVSPFVSTNADHSRSPESRVTTSEASIHNRE